ncbi:hypothetical protein KBY25_05995 [Ruegeria pomeroyi]|nr:hypothetical protein [Ruegeria pomeroyi]
MDRYLSRHHLAYYPGVADGILIVSQSCLGSGPRVLIGASRPSPKALSLVEIAADGTSEETAYQFPGFLKPASLDDLPRSIGRLVRRDLVGKCPDMAKRTFRK